MKRKRLKYAIFREYPNDNIVQVAGLYTNKREAYDAGTLDYVL